MTGRRRILGLAGLVVAGLLCVPRSVLAQEEGVKVHGHWVIEIHNPDGTLATRSEFENSLSQGGQAVLGWLLSRVNTAVPQGGPWRISTYPEGSAGSPSCGAGPCRMQEDRGEVTVQYVESSRSVLLQGRALAESNGSIGSVQTSWAFICGNATCVQSFSGTTMSVAVPIAAGQSMLVTVVFTFS